MTNYKIITECRSEGKSPVITTYRISQDQYERIREIAQENSPKNTGKKIYPFIYNPGVVER